MECMFSGCTNFNQPLNTWTIKNSYVFEGGDDEIYCSDTMFRNCNISKENKPIFKD